MKSIGIMLTNKCNKKCFYCTRPEYETSMSPRTASIILQKLIPYIKQSKENIQIVFTGGEPLLEADLLKFIAFGLFESIKESSYKKELMHELNDLHGLFPGRLPITVSYKIYTNGGQDDLVSYVEFCRSLQYIHSRVDDFTKVTFVISWDGIHKINAIKRAQIAKKYGFDVVIRIVVNHQNRQKILNFLPELCARDLHETLEVVEDFTDHDNQDELIRTTKDIVDIVTRSFGRVPPLIINRCCEYDEPMIISCRDDNIIFTPDGYVVGCTMLADNPKLKTESTLIENIPDLAQFQAPKDEEFEEFRTDVQIGEELLARKIGYNGRFEACPFKYNSLELEKKFSDFVNELDRKYRRDQCNTQ